MKIILFICCFLILTLSCEKVERNDWKCENIVIIYPPNFPPDTIKNIIWHYNITDEQMEMYIQIASYTTTQIYEGDTTIIVSRMNNCGRCVNIKP